MNTEEIVKRLKALQVEWLKQANKLSDGWYGEIGSDAKNDCIDDIDDLLDEIQAE